MGDQSEMERLRRELDEARERAQRAEEDARRAEEDARRAEEDARRAEEDARRAEEDTRATTLAEYIEACHELFSNFTVEADKRLTSKGSITSPSDRRCPPRLEPWAGFLEEQRVVLGTLFSASSSRVFRSRHYMRTRGEVIARKPVGDEEALKFVLGDMVAEPVKLIMEHLRGILEDEYNIGPEISFETRFNAISDAALEPGERPMTPDNNKFRPDQICVYTCDENDPAVRSMAYVIEQKAPHKLTLPHLRLGLRQMDIYKDVVHRVTKPPQSDEEALFQYHADRLAAAAVTQTFDYMVEAGLKYGCLTTGEAIVFLKVDWAHPMTLYYHLAEPGPEVDAHADNFLCCTAVSQMLAFTVMALHSQVQGHGVGQDARQDAIDRLKVWKQDYDVILRCIPETERTAPPMSPAYRARTYKNIERSPYNLRHIKKTPDRGGDNPPQPSRKDPSSDSSDDDPGGPQVPGTPTPSQPRRGTRRGRSQQPRGGRSGRGNPQRSGHAHNRQYCTQRCLLGLVNNSILDEACPNVKLHRQQRIHSRCHPVDHATWLGLLRHQLARTLDDGIKPLGKQGARGVLFQVTLLAHGYTFVAKGTTARFVRELERESAVYRRLKPLQGARVPVFLGAADLRELGRTYYYDFLVYVVHLTFLAWGGPSLDDVAFPAGDRGRIREEVVEAVRALHGRGVAHTDVRVANVLWSEEPRRPMLIDFEQAVLAELPQRHLAPAVPNKRARDATGPAGVDEALGRPRGHLPVGVQNEDILAAGMVF